MGVLPVTQSPFIVCCLGSAWAIMLRDSKLGEDPVDGHPEGQMG